MARPPAIETETGFWLALDVSSLRLVPIARSARADRFYHDGGMVLDGHIVLH